MENTVMVGLVECTWDIRIRPGGWNRCISINTISITTDKLQKIHITKVTARAMAERLLMFANSNQEVEMIYKTDKELFNEQLGIARKMTAYNIRVALHQRNVLHRWAVRAYEQALEEKEVLLRKNIGI